MNLVGDPNAYELAYRAGLQAVDEQSAVLRETRDRAGSLLSAAAVAGGLTAGLSFSSDRAQAIGTVGAIGETVRQIAVMATPGCVTTSPQFRERLDLQPDGSTLWVGGC